MDYRKHKQIVQTLNTEEEEQRIVFALTTEGNNNIDQPITFETRERVDSEIEELGVGVRSSNDNTNNGGGQSNEKALDTLSARTAMNLIRDEGENQQSQQLNKRHNQSQQQQQQQQQQQELNTSQTTTPPIRKKMTFVSTSVMDRKQAKSLFGRAVAFDNKGQISSCSSFRTRYCSDDFNREVSFMAALQSAMQKYLIISPRSFFRLFWDLLSIILILYSCLYNAFELSFDNSTDLNYSWLELTVEIFFTLDIVQNFFSAYYSSEEDKEITQFKPIAIRYLKSSFAIDVLSVFPFQIFGQDVKGLKLLRMFRLPRFLKLLREDRFMRIVDTILRYSDTQDKVKTQFIFLYIYRNVQFILTGLGLAYFVACFWYFLISSENYKDLSGNDFISTYGFDYMPDWKKVILNCYFVMTTFSTVGFGDMAPITNQERIIVIVMMLAGIAFFSYIMNNFNDVLANHWKKLGYVDRRVEIEEWILSLSNYTERTIDKKLVNKIQSHFEYFYRHSRLSIISKKDKYFTLMPKDLKKTMIRHLFQDIFYTSFRSLFLLNGKTECSDYGFYIDTAFSLIPMKYASGETICKQGDKVSEVYLVLEGEIEASFTLDNVKVSRFFQSGFFFGAINILSNKLCRVDYKASKNVKLLVWDRSKFIDIINRYEDMKQHIISVSFQSFKTTKNAMIQAMILAIKAKKGITLDEQSASRIFRNMVRYVYEQKSKQHAYGNTGSDNPDEQNEMIGGDGNGGGAQAKAKNIMMSRNSNVKKDLSEVERRLKKVQNYVHQIDSDIVEKKQQSKLLLATQHIQMQNLIRKLQ